MGFRRLTLGVLVVIAVAVGVYLCMRKGAVSETIAEQETNRIIAVQAPLPQRAALPPVISGHSTVSTASHTVTATTISNAILCGTALTGDGNPMDSFGLAVHPATNALAAPAWLTVAPDAKGWYVITNLHPGACVIRVGYQCGSLLDTNMVLHAGTNVLDLTFPQLHAVVIRGRTVIERTGEPASFVRLAFEREAVSGTWLSFASDADGNFQFPLVSPGIGGKLIVDEDRFGRPRYRITADAAYREMLVMLRETGIVRGHVRTVDGQPVAGIKVSVYANALFNTKRVNFAAASSSWHSDIACWYGSVTSNDGSYIMPFVCAPGEYRADVESDEYRIPTWEHQSPVTLDVAPGKITECNLTVESRPVIMLKVHDEGGAPVLQYRLRIAEYKSTLFLMEKHPRTEEVCLGTDSWHEVKVKGNLRRIPLMLDAIAPDQAFASTNLGVTGVTATNYIILTARHCTPRLAGRLLRSIGGPWPNAELRVMHTLGQISTTTATDDDGRFRVFDIEGQDGDTVRLYSNYSRTNVVLGSLDIEWVLPWVSPSPYTPDTNMPRIFTISGRVCIESPSTPATSFAIGRDRFNLQSFNSPDGRFQLVMQEGQGGDFMFLAPGYAALVRPITADSDADLGDIVLESKLAVVMGRVVDHDGRPQAETVELAVDDSWPAAVVSGGGDGSYVFTDVKPGQGTVKLAGSRNSIAIDLDIAPGATVRVPDLVIGAGSNEVRVMFTFLLPDGTPARNAMVTTPFFWGNTGERGDVSMLVPPGFHDGWRVWCGEKTYHAKPFDISTTTRSITVMLTVKCRLAGRITLDGLPLRCLDLTFQRDGQDEQMCLTTMDRFELYDDPGVYIASVARRFLYAVVVLHEGDDNVVAFTSDRTSLQIMVDGPRTWRVWLKLSVADRLVETGGYEASRESPVTITSLPAGEHHVIAESTDAGVTQKCVRAVTLVKDQPTTVRIGGSD